MQLGVNQANEHPLNRFVSDGSLDAYFVESFDDQLSGFVEVLNTFGVVDQYVGPVDSVDLSHNILVHAVFTKLGSNALGVRISNRTVAQIS